MRTLTCFDTHVSLTFNHLRWILTAAVVANLLGPSAPAQTAQKSAIERIPVLAYHRFDPDKAGPTTVRTRTFESQLVWLAANSVTAGTEP
jgi:hypothetical protein